MSEDETLRSAEAQLDRVLGFFPRVDAKASAVFAIDVGLLGLLCLNFRPEDMELWYVWAPAVLAAVLIFGSLWHAFHCHFPHLEGGSRSLIYFRSIAAFPEATFLTDFKAQSPAERTDDVLAQVWRNSEILKVKFDAVQTAFLLTLVSVVPWVIFLAVSSVRHAAAPMIS